MFHLQLKKQYSVMVKTDHSKKKKKLITLESEYLGLNTGSTPYCACPSFLGWGSCENQIRKYNKKQLGLRLAYSNYISFYYQIDKNRKNIGKGVEN